VRRRHDRVDCDALIDRQCPTLHDRALHLGRIALDEQMRRIGESRCLGEGATGPDRIAHVSARAAHCPARHARAAQFDELLDGAKRRAQQRRQQADRQRHNMGTR